VVLRASVPGALVVAGGLLSGGASSTAVNLLNPVSGSVKPLGQLTMASHDAAGAVIRGKGYVFGGGSSAPSNVVQRIESRGVPSASAEGIVARLPSARADAAAVTIGETTYLVGGYDGRSADGGVLATTDGVHFRSVARLARSVRYPAVAAIGGSIYVFGGDPVGGSRSGPTRMVQRVNTSNGRVSVVGSLPIDLAGAAAVNIAGTVYIAGGETNAGRTSGAIRESRAIYAWDPRTDRALFAGHLFVAVSHAGIAVLGRRAWLVGGETASGAVTGVVQMLEPNAKFGFAGRPGAGSPYYGDTLLIADRGNDRLLALSDRDRVVWQYPSAHAAAPAGGFYFPDDAFFIRHGSAIISNQEENDTLVEIGYPSGRVLWSYGHPRHAGSAPGYLNTPDDAYLLADGEITVADAYNCRVLIIDPATKRIVRQIGTSGVCAHDPPKSIYSPNGDTPLENGNLLVSEVTGSWVDEFTTRGKLVWSVKLPIAYPSDPQQLSADRFLIADYASPGAFVEFNAKGVVLYRYEPTSGPGELNRPSLVERLPSGVLMANDDYNERMVAIDPSTGAVVWQYGRTGVPGKAKGLVDTPDGFDLLGPGGSFPTHPATG
ncbi:MAG: PQQ-binding-like beta-propeller repeat protein, partial [Acidimicrobiales bacterium]